MSGPTPESAQAAPVVTVIVPARNEEVSLGACLVSLVEQKQLSQDASAHAVPFEIIVVDDHSTDRTREIATSFAGVRVIEAGPLPQGWTGKNNAVAAGAQEARGEWLLFTDADTVHLPGSLARSLAEAKRQEAVMLSYSPEQIVETFWEKAVMPVVFAELRAHYRPSDVSDPNSPAAAANGQYILIRRDVYDAIGGHAAVAGELLEDLALARKLKQSRQKIFFRYGGDAVRTRMYRGYAQLRDGWTRSLTIVFPRPRRLAAQVLLKWSLSWVALLCGVLLFLRSPSMLRALAALVLAAPFAKLYVHIHRAHFAVACELLAMTCGLPMFAYFLFRSASAHGRNAVGWKGRQYAGYEAARPSSKASAAVQSRVVTSNRELTTRTDH
jgi:glycosyltransferase involved in cell wall biosynthesis